MSESKLLGADRLMAAQQMVAAQQELRDYKRTQKKVFDTEEFRELVRKATGSSALVEDAMICGSHCGSHCKNHG